MYSVKGDGMKKKIIVLVSVFALILTFAGCSAAKLPQGYYNAPNKNFAGMKHEYYSNDATSFNQAVDRMVYTELPKIIKKELEDKGNKINEVTAHYANAEVYREDETLAVIGITVEADGGEVKSGDYELAAYFTYDLTESNKRIYFINYTFIENEDEFRKNNGAAMFDEIADAMK